jgi:chorismate mutase
MTSRSTIDSAFTGVLVDAGRIHHDIDFAAWCHHVRTVDAALTRLADAIDDPKPDDPPAERLARNAFMAVLALAQLLHGTYSEEPRASSALELAQLAVHELLDALIGANRIDAHDVVSAIFSATPDVRSRNPATSARALGWTDVPLMCVAELETDGMLERCVRVLLHVAVADGRRLTPVYLGAASCLRPDLVPLADLPLGVV